MNPTEVFGKVKQRWVWREWRARARRDDADTQALLARVLTPASNCVDVGANAGEFLRYFTAQAPQGRHVAVEPVPALAEQLREQFPGVEVHACALSGEAGEAPFFWVVDDPAWSGLSVQEYPEGKTVQEIPMRLERLDDLVGHHVDFLKIDVEGAELGVLEGAQRILTTDRPTVLMEHAIIHAREYDTRPEQVHAALTGCGYEIRTLAGTGPCSELEFVEVCERSDATGYDRTAQTNWVATPALRS